VGVRGKEVFASLMSRKASYIRLNANQPLGEMSGEAGGQRAMAARRCQAVRTAPSQPQFNRLRAVLSVFSAVVSPVMSARVASLPYARYGQLSYNVMERCAK